jgi:hypothetical protein
MADRLVIDVFCEDSGHETFLRNLIKVLASSVSIPTPELRLHSARGGHGRAVHSLKAWQRALRDGHQPHVEVWCTADPEAFQSLFSAPVPQPPSRSGRLVYKRWLSDALEQAGVPVLTDPMEICLDLLPVMDMVKACRNDDALNHLVSEIRAWLNRNLPS